MWTPPGLPWVLAHLGVSPEKLEEVVRESEVWASPIRLLALWSRRRWMDIDSTSITLACFCENKLVLYLCSWLSQLQYFIFIFQSCQQFYVTCLRAAWCQVVFASLRWYITSAWKCFFSSEFQWCSCVSCLSSLSFFHRWCTVVLTENEDFRVSMLTSKRGKQERV